MTGRRLEVGDAHAIVAVLLRPGLGLALAVDGGAHGAAHGGGSAAVVRRAWDIRHAVEGLVSGRAGVVGIGREVDGGRAAGQVGRDAGLLHSGD